MRGCRGDGDVLQRVSIGGLRSSRGRPLRAGPRDLPNRFARKLVEIDARSRLDRAILDPCSTGLALGPPHILEGRRGHLLRSQRSGASARVADATLGVLCPHAPDERFAQT